MSRLSASGLEKYVRVQKLCNIEHSVLVGVHYGVEPELAQLRVEAINKYLALFGIAGVQLDRSSTKNGHDIELSWQGRYIDRD